MQQLLDDGGNEKIGIDSEVLYSLSKWGKVSVVVVCLRVLYNLSKSGWYFYSLHGTLAGEWKYKVFHVLVIMISLTYIPSIWLFFKFYAGLSRSLDIESAEGLEHGFRNLKDGIIWSIIAGIVDFALLFCYENFNNFLKI